MARSEARIYAEIWEDADFVALDPAAQRLYMFLLSQPDLAHSGVIALRERRWSRKAAGLTASDIERDLKALEAARFVVVDWDTEELLIRSFMRRDKVFRMPNVMRSAVDHIALISSAAILEELADEVERITGLEMTDGAVAVVADMKNDLAARLDAINGTTSRKGIENPSEKGSGEDDQLHPGVRGMSETVGKGSPNPYPHDPGPSMSADALIPLDKLAESAMKPKALPPRVVAAYFNRAWDAYPRKVAKGEAEKAFIKAVKAGTDPEVIIAGIIAYRDHGPRQRAEIQYTKYPATWINAKCWMDDLATDAKAAPSTTPEIVPLAEQCPNPDHRGQRASTCRICASQRKAGTRP